MGSGGVNVVPISITITFNQFKKHIKNAMFITLVNKTNVLIWGQDYNAFTI